MSARREAGLRRSLDVVCSILGLLLLLPLLLGLGFMVKLDSRGPVFFTQRRVGLGGREFTLYKFRTMAQRTTGPEVTAGNDARITRLGRHLRRAKLDELPQLLNVLRADMSLVGPRPEVLRYVRCWTQEQRNVVLSVRPGLTDPITLTLRWEESLLATAGDPEAYYVRELLPQKAQGYADYVRHRTLASDAAVLLRTGHVLVTHARAMTA